MFSLFSSFHSFLCFLVKLFVELLLQTTDEFMTNFFIYQCMHTLRTSLLA